VSWFGFVIIRVKGFGGFFETRIGTDLSTNYTDEWVARGRGNGRAKRGAGLVARHEGEGNEVSGWMVAGIKGIGIKD